VRKNNVLNCVFGCCIGLYAIILLLNIIGVYPFTLAQKFWFELFLFMLSVILITRSILFKSDSSTFLGVTLFLNSILFAIRNIYALKFLQILPIVLGTITISALFIYILFRNKLYLKVLLWMLLVSALSTLLYLVV